MSTHSPALQADRLSGGTDVLFRTEVQAPEADSTSKRASSGDPQARLTVAVVDRSEASDGVVTLTLADPHGLPLPEWSAGAHIDVHLDDETVRQYSLCSIAPEQERWRIGVLREANGRGGSKTIHDSVQLGNHLTVGHPRNNFALVQSKKYIFIAGGIGVTPILSMIGQAERDGATWSLIYGGRSLSTMAFSEELSAYGDRVRLVPEDTEGRVNFAELLGEVQDETLIYCCGPEPLLKAVEEASAHWPLDSLHTERFVPKKIETAADTEFDVEFVDSGVTLRVPADQSILEVAERAGLPVLSSCGEGTCGTCETTVLEGTPDHRDSILTASEKERGDTMFICVSRSKSGCPLKLML